jgi:hypothetical protein
MLHAIVKVCWLAGFRDNFQVTNAPANGDPELVSVDNPGKESTCLSPLFRFGQQVFVSRKQDPVQRCSAFEEFIIGQ